MIKRIVIKGESGYGPIDMAYKDKVTVTESSIAYEYTPYIEVETNIPRKWAYRTNNPDFKNLFSAAAEMIPAVLAIDEPWVTDIGDTTFIITYDDGRKETKSFGLPGDAFQDTFSIIKKMVPGCEDLPAVLMTSDDYKEQA